MKNASCEVPVQIVSLALYLELSLGKKGFLRAIFRSRTKFLFCFINERRKRALIGLINLKNHLRKYYVAGLSSLCRISMMRDDRYLL